MARKVSEHYSKQLLHQQKFNCHFYGETTFQYSQDFWKRGVSFQLSTYYTSHMGENTLARTTHSPSSLRPVVESGSVGWVHPGLVGRPEPAVDVLGQKVVPVTTVKVAHTARSPEILGSWKREVKWKSSTVCLWPACSCVVAKLKIRLWLFFILPSL